ncbi:putative phosphatidylinositol 4-kinase alpha-like protein P2 [Artemia franciscana]
MDVNKFKDKKGCLRDPVLYDILDGIVSSIIEGFSDADRELYTQEFAFVKAITSISEKITKFHKGEERKTACNDLLKEIKVPNGCYLPCSPEAHVLDIDNTSGKPLQSAAKAPFLANFKVVRSGI